MPLSMSAPRESIHTRQIECQGYRRADGLWDIEGHLTDVKAHPFPNEWRGELQPGEKLHEMWLRITVDDTLTIRAVEAVTDHSPFRICPEITGNFQRLVGLAISPGFTLKLKEAVGGVEGCTHLVELMGPVATTAFQTIAPLRTKAMVATPGARPALLNTCHAFSSDGEIVAENYPRFYTGTSREGGRG